MKKCDICYICNVVTKEPIQFIASDLNLVTVELLKQRRTKGENNKWQISVWGIDDIGYSLAVEDMDIAKKIFRKLTGLKNIKQIKNENFDIDPTEDPNIPIGPHILSIVELRELGFKPDF